VIDWFFIFVVVAFVAIVAYSAGRGSVAHINCIQILAEQRRKLWMLLDHIDTLDDSCRDDDLTFRALTRVCQKKRFEIWVPADDAEVKTPQQRVAAWVAEVLGADAAQDGPERVLRTAEEVVELAQAVGLSSTVLHRLVDYVYARPVGDAAQEIGGSLITLYSAAEALGVDVETQFEKELARVRRPEVVERVRRRQQEKREALVGDVGDVGEER